MMLHCQLVSLSKMHYDVTLSAVCLSKIQYDVTLSVSLLKSGITQFLEENILF
jgi:hypothetical protein